MARDTPTIRDLHKSQSNGETEHRNACTSAVVARMCGRGHLKGRYLHTMADVKRAMQANGYSTRSMMTAFKRNVRCKSGLRVKQVIDAFHKLIDDMWNHGESKNAWLTAAEKPHERLEAIMYVIDGHVGMVDITGRVTDTAYKPSAKVVQVYGIYARRWDHAIKHARVVRA